MLLLNTNTRRRDWLPDYQKRKIKNCCVWIPQEEKKKKENVSQVTLRAQEQNGEMPINTHSKITLT